MEIKPALRPGKSIRPGDFLACCDDRVTRLVRSELHRHATMSHAPRRAEYLLRQGLLCTEASSHCRKADSFGGSVRPAGETR